MPKKQNLNDLINNVPSPTTKHTNVIVFLFAFLMFSMLIYIGSVTYTGFAVSEINQPELEIIRNENLLLSNRFEVLEVNKLAHSVLDVEVKSDLLINVFMETSDCSYWKSGQDRDNAVLYSINGIKNGVFRAGDPSQNTVQQIELYEKDSLCLIFINREFPKSGNINLKLQETEVNKWRIV